jgi:NADH-quinone oxidoreductase subunit L
MFFMGGLFRKMPVTATTFLVGALALAAIPPFSGFWSKDDILNATLASGNTVLFAFAIATAGLTAFYIFRAWFMTFLGERRLNPALAEHSGHGGNGGGHGSGGDAHESPLSMTGPLVVLSFFALFFGFVGSPLFDNAFQRFIGGPTESIGELNLGLAIVSTAIGLTGILLAWGFYGANWFSAAAMTKAFHPIYVLLIKKYYVDDVYNWIAGRALQVLSEGLAWFDRNVVDGLVNGVAWVAYALVGWTLTRAESGRLPNYALVFFIGVILVAGVVVGLPVGR